MRGLNKPIPEANYKSKNEKQKWKDTRKWQILLNSALVASMYDRMTPLMEGKKKKKKK